MTDEERYPLALRQGVILAGKYIIESVLGQGGFGITYKAKDYSTGSFVAIKEFFPEMLAHRENTMVLSYTGEKKEDFDYGKNCFLEESETLAQFIGYNNIVRIYNYFEENGTAYYVMDYLEGMSFEEYLRQRNRKISMEEAKNILLPIMDALTIVHSKGIVHRDVTPDNIYICNDGTVKLLDFGAARYSLGDRSQSLDIILKHGFAPKEQYMRRGKQGPFTDIYCLGATFYYAITGKRPPDAVERIDRDELVPPSKLDTGVTKYQEQAILQAMAVQPQDRFQSMEVFKRVLLSENTGKSSGSGKGKKIALIAVIAIFMISLAVLGIYFATRESSENRIVVTYNINSNAVNQSELNDAVEKINVYADRLGFDVNVRTDSSGKITVDFPKDTENINIIAASIASYLSMQDGIDISVGEIKNPK